MPAESLLVPAIASGSQVLGQGISAISQSVLNKKSRKWHEKMYDRQRADSLADWTMQNEYNSPAAQMQRLRNAGLNPNLVYGNGATTEAATVRASDTAGSWNPEAPRFDLGQAAQSGLQSYFDIQIRQGQADLLKAQNTIAMEDVALKRAQTLATLANTANSNFDLKNKEYDYGFKSELRQTYMDTAHAQLAKLKADTKFTLDANERAAAMQAPTLQKAAEEILMLRAQRANSAAQRQEIFARIESIKRDNQIKDFEIQLNKNGVTKNDELWQRILSNIVDGLGSLNPIKGIKSFFGFGE